MAKFKRGNGGLNAKIEAWADEIEKDVAKGVRETALVIKNSAVNKAPRKSGDLIASIKAQQRGKFEARVTVGQGLEAPYHIYTEYGTGIYSTVGSRAKSIPWTFYSKDLGRWVTMYGMKAQPYWTPSLLLGEQYFNNYF